MSIKQDGPIRHQPGVRHRGTAAFGKRVANNRKRSKAARKARRKKR